MTEVMEAKDVYLANFSEFEKGLSGRRQPWLERLRAAAIDRFAALGFPTLRDEEWRFTNLAPLSHVPFRPAANFALDGEETRKLEQATSEAGKCCRIVFVNGRHAPQFSSIEGLPATVIVDSLAAVLASHPGLVEPHLARHAAFEEHAFVALNTAFVQDGAFVSIPRGQVVKTPIHLVFVSTTRGDPTVSHPRNLVLADVNSQGTLIESYVGLGDDTYFTNAVTEIVLAENAVVDHYKLQRESPAGFHLATLQVALDRGSNFSNHAVTLGGLLVRNDLNAVLGAEGCECTLNGLYMASGRQLVDNHTRIDHARPHGTSHELYKGILDGQARGVFNGKIYVHPDAQKTDAKQTNKTLLLSPDALIDTKPQLEIYADDVKCTHGATIGQLAEEAIFYLRSRGIGRVEARSLLTYAFANDIIGRIKVEAVRAQLEGVLLASQHLSAGRDVEESPL
jgi:Fe-S cluster assembly protein SufD